MSQATATTCKNCLGSIEDLRSKATCQTCGGIMHKDCPIKEDGKNYCDTCYTIKKEEGESIDFTVPDVISRSYIDTYSYCPYKFYMEYIKGIESEHTIYTRLGVDVHNLVDRACQDSHFGKEEMLKEFHELWQGYEEKLFEDDEQREKMYQRGINSIDNACSLIAEMPEPLSTEENIIFSVGEGLPKVSTTSDRIDKVNGELEISDWKTGAVMVGQKLSSDWQAPLYIYGVRQKYELPIRKFTFYYLQDGKERTFERTSNEDYVCTVRKREYFINLTDVIRKVQSLFSRILKGEFNVPYSSKNMYFNCKMCHLRQKEICQGVELEGWKQPK